MDSEAETPKGKEPTGSTLPLDSSTRTSIDRIDVAEKKSDAANPNQITGVKFYILMAGVICSAFLMALNGSIIATAIPQITSHFDSLEDIGWYGAAYLIVTCSLQPLVGKIYTHFPVKQTYITFVGIFVLGSLICGVAISSSMLIVGRAVQGIGGPGILNGALTTIAAAAPKDNKPMLVGVAMGIGTIGTVIGPLIGGALTQHVSWRWCFYINLPPGGLVLLGLLLLDIPEQVEKKPVKSNLKSIISQELDLIGFVLFAPACIMFLLAMNWGGTQFRWDSATIIGLFCGGFATFVVFVLWEIHCGDKAMIPPRIVRHNLVIWGCWTSCFQMGGSLLLSYYLPVWFQVVKGASPTMSGVMVLPTAISQMFGAVLAGKFVQIVGYCTAWSLVGCVLLSIGSGLMTLFVPATGPGAWIGYQILVGVGRGSVLQMPITAIQNLLPAKTVAIATSQVFFFQYFGGAVILAAGETIFSNSLRSALGKYAPGVDAQAILEAGATSVRLAASSEKLPEILVAYNRAIVNTVYLALGGSLAAFATSFGMGWQRLPKKEAATATASKKTGSAAA